jgi:lysophospholipase L1-like esterase
MRHRRPILAFIAGIALACSLLPAGSGHVQAGSAAKATPPLGSYYLALGDSLAVGYQPDTNPAVPTSWTFGYVYQFRDMLSKIAPAPIELQNLGVRGECTNTLIKGGLSPSCPTKVVNTPSQLAEAVAFIKDHPGRVNPITVDIGGNNLNGNAAKFLAANPLDQLTLITKLFTGMTQDWTTIFSTLRKACPTCNIIAINQYNPYPKGALKTDLAPVFENYSSILARVAKATGVKMADVYTPFVGHEILYTWISIRDIHATNVGYQVYAEVVAKASGYPIQIIE